MIPIDIQIEAIDYGYSTWNPKHYQVPWIRGRNLSLENKQGFSKCAKHRITLDELRECLKLNQAPPKLRDITETNQILTSNPLLLPKGARQYINHNEKPYCWTCAIPLYVAQQNGCNLQEIDFLLCGKRVLTALYERSTNAPKEHILLEIKKGILMIVIVSEDDSRRSDKNDVGHQYERFIRDETFKESSDLKECRNIRQIRLGGYNVLVSAKVDCIDNNGDPIETKLHDFFQDSNRNGERKAMDLLLTMISNGSVGAVLGNRTWETGNERNKGKCTLNSVQSYSLEYVLDYVQCKTYNVEEFTEQLNTENLFQPVIETLNELKKLVIDGTISDKPNSFYKMTFKYIEEENINKILIEPVNMKGTIDYCSQYLYEALLEDHGIPKDLDSLATNCGLVVSHVKEEYKKCECNESSSIKETSTKWRRNCDVSKIRQDFLNTKISN